MVFNDVPTRTEYLAETARRAVTLIQCDETAEYGAIE
jgi:hypothetical protein